MSEMPDVVRYGGHGIGEPTRVEGHRVDTGYAPDSWEFDGEVTRVFDDMLGRSIPEYDAMRSLVTDVASRFVHPSLATVDLGCSRGEALLRVIDNVSPIQAEFVAVEMSAPMLEAAREELAGKAQVWSHDLRKGYPKTEHEVSCTLCVLTMMFVPVNYRPQLFYEAGLRTCQGGAFILVEKVVGPNGPIDDVLQANYHRLKTMSGYTPEDIERKRLSLEGTLVPLTASMNEMFLKEHFGSVDCFWAWGPFRAWLAVKR